MNNLQQLSNDHDLRFKEVWEYTQRGLVYPSPNAIFASYWLNDKHSISKSKLRDLKLHLRKEIHNSGKLKKRNTTAILGVGVSF